MNTTVFTAEFDTELLEQAAAVLAKDGDTLPGMVRQMMHYIVDTGQAPDLQCFEPNAETLAAIAEARNGELVGFDTFAELLADLNSDEED